MTGPADDLEPLFDYKRVQQHNFVCIDDDDTDVVAVPSKKRKKGAKPVVPVDDDDDDLKVIKITQSKDKDEEDWLPPPPKVSNEVQNRASENSTIKELRLKKQELASLANAEVMLKAVEESAKRKFSSLEQASMESIAEKPPKQSCERAKIVIKIQGKHEVKHFRVYKDEKFELLFKGYADKIKEDIKNLVFVFDGEKVNPTATPDTLEMEDDDMIEVDVRKS
ncbi:hypothetical protein Tsubulata_018721 [Turnera subulata]|uniref:Rad60/SUMO-like domain-containing protein n=1 Tax=Turnera subulata TaxID=218843 RepID=A0A9Q0GFL7_9ROSI|nr:hypothetical protein Tsubulata_018721 [Turnera subulata]